ncbi:HepT-like ribonuclease domain-containing protein [Lunatibacter salilacus]|uniref:HepT-like ribonuclease domain-containing protein n=1 Tax=Lunatibacter salilacus TaxID=2483804 RepID=UPI00131E425A|nr:HepT-like ribonuclease domain-containing protein [Lunatibacter salilacus]
MKKGDKSLNRFREILQAIAKINEYMRLTNWDDFKTSSMLKDAVLFQFAVISDAILEVDNSYLEKYDYPWYLLKTFRILLRQDNFEIRHIAVWHTIKENIVDLEKSVKLILNNEF